MPMVYPQTGPGFPKVGHSPALDALQQLGTASPTSGMAPNMNRLTETEAPLQGLQHVPRRPLQNMAPERREKPSFPALEG